MKRITEYTHLHMSSADKFCRVWSGRKNQYFDRYPKNADRPRLLYGVGLNPRRIK